MELAKSLVVNERVSYAEAAERTGIPLSTLQKRGAVENWMDKRQSTAAYADKVHQLKHRALDAANAAFEALAAGQESGVDPIQLTHAWRTVETAYPEHRYATEADPKAKAAVATETLRLLVEYLVSKDKRELVAQLAPHIEPFGAHLIEVWHVG